MRVYTLLLAGICILIFMLQIIIPGFTNIFILNQNSFVEPWRFVSSIFLHNDITHLIFNLFALILFGLILEYIIGSKKFLFSFFSAGIFANLISINFYSSSLGASGAIFGVIGALTIIKPLMPIWAFGIPMPIFFALVIWAVSDILMTFMPTNVGTIAHLSGLFLGLILGLFFREKTKRRARNKIRISDEDLNYWESKYMK
ncbi:MAG: rhomboid family intramembrane serine protease [Candidatus Pacearchaeota archaeon]